MKKYIFLLTMSLCIPSWAQEWGSDIRVPRYRAASGGAGTGVPQARASRAMSNIAMLYQQYGEDYDRHARWHMQLLSHYIRPSGSARASSEEAEASVKALSVLASGASPVISADSAFWSMKELINVMRFAPDTHLRGLAALGLSIAAGGKGHRDNYFAADALKQAVIGEGDYANRRLAVTGLSGIGTPYSVRLLAEAASAVAASHNFMGRHKYRAPEEDESDWSLEAAMMAELDVRRRARDDSSTAARDWLVHFAALDRACGNRNMIGFPDDDGFDETLVVNARLLLAEAGMLTTRRDNPETGSISCLLPMANAADTCRVRKKAAELFARYHGDVITDRPAEGGADCSELFVQKAAAKIAGEFITGLAGPALVKNLIRGGARVARVFAGISAERRIVAYRRVMLNVARDVQEARELRDNFNIRKHLEEIEEITK